MTLNATDSEQHKYRHRVAILNQVEAGDKVEDWVSVCLENFILRKVQKFLFVGKPTFFIHIIIKFLNHHYSNSIVVINSNIIFKLCDFPNELIFEVQSKRQTHGPTDRRKMNNETNRFNNHISTVLWSIK